MDNEGYDSEATTEEGAQSYDSDGYSEGLSAAESTEAACGCQEPTGDPASPPPNAHTFDNALPIKHTYLGENLEELSGRTLLDEGSVHTLPLVPQSGVVLIPGQTLPLTIFYQPTITMLRNSVNTDRTFGVVSVRYVDEVTPKVADFGTTAEIYAFHDFSEGGNPEFRIKAKGRQRFKIIDMSNTAQGLVGKVLILPELVFPNLLAQITPLSLRRRYGNSESGSKRQAMLTQWPLWLHRLYDTRHLVERTVKLLRHLKNGDETYIPSDPVELSYWVAQSMPLEDGQRLQLLRIDSAIQRLRWELSILENCQILCCQRCSRQIADCKDVFSMSVEGPQGTYVNPGGFVHETMTLHQANGLVVEATAPSYEYSWFPGYGWTIVQCHGCRKHMGWLFTTIKPDLHPKSFFGLRRQSLVIQIHPNCENNARPIF